MRGYAKIVSASILMMGLLAVPNLSQATDGDGRHRLLNAELRSKIEHVGNKIEEHREHQQNRGGIPGYIQALQTEVANLKAALADANAQLAKLSDLVKRGGGGGGTSPELTELAKLAPYVTVNANTLNGVKGPHVIFHGANVHVQSGSGTTAEADKPTGLGNLIVGYNEIPGPEMSVLPGASRVGSHNLVVGSSHVYTSTGGAVFGNSNLISAQSATILGGDHNSALGLKSSVVAGDHNTVTVLGEGSSILGGREVIMSTPQYTFP